MDVSRLQRRVDFAALVAAVEDYAIFMLSPEGRVASWNSGAKRIKGYDADEILGRPFSVFYPPEDVIGGANDYLHNVLPKVATENANYQRRIARLSGLEAGR